MKRYSCVSIIFVLCLFRKLQKQKAAKQWRVQTMKNFTALRTLTIGIAACALAFAPLESDAHGWHGGGWGHHGGGIGFGVAALGVAALATTAAIITAPFNAVTNAPYYAPPPPPPAPAAYYAPGYAQAPAYYPPAPGYYYPQTAPAYYAPGYYYR
jgi:hypothetical protein